MASKEEIALIGKLRNIKNYIEKTYVSIACGLWLIATFWDIYKLQRYWFDYAIELYTSIVVFLMMVYSINPQAIPYKVYKSFKIITKVKGRGCLLLLISFLFLGDNHFFHRLCAILLLIGGILCFACEILIPTTKEELIKISENYDKKKQSKINDTVEIKNKLEPNNNLEEKSYDYNINMNHNTEKEDENIKNNNSNINKDKLPDINVKIEDGDGATSVEKKLEKNIQSSNPYDLPDDF